ncbi:MAG: hypothetical protein ACTS2F_08155 [Thainema sp.]
MNIKKVEYLVRRSREKLWDIVDDTVRLWSSKDAFGNHFVNQKEIRVLGLRRSGNHGIVNWICKQSPENHVFINHCRVKDNPYRNVYRDQIFLQKNSGLKGWRCENINWWKQESQGNFSPKDCLIYSYEDQEISRVSHPSFEYKHDLYLGKSKVRFDVIIIRDPFNLIASRIKGNIVRENARNFDLLKVYSKTINLPEMWLAYAKECLGETNYLNNHKVIIRYNSWFSDESYRQSIAEQMGLDFSDAGFDEVVRAGGIGSSFDGTDFSGKASEMEVLTRWKHLVDNSLFREMISTPGLIDYSEKLFGYIPGTEILK